MKILVVEDERASRRAVVRVLEDAGYEVIWAASAMGAIRLLITEQPNMVLLDILLGDEDLNGFDVARFMGGDIKLRAIPIIVTSGLPATEIRERARTNAFEGLRMITMEKPLDALALVREVKRIFDASPTVT